MAKRLPFIAIGVVIILFVIIPFYYSIGIDATLSDDDKNWASFGNYFGGVATPLLSFLNFWLIINTIKKSEQQIELARYKILKQDFIEHISKADEEIERWLQKKLAVKNETGVLVEFGDIVWGLVKPGYPDEKEFQKALSRLSKLIFGGVLDFV